MRSGAGYSEKRGPLAFIVDPAHDDGFARIYAKVTENEGPLSLFKSLREARVWLDRIQHGVAADAPVSIVRDHSPWTDPYRRGFAAARRPPARRHCTIPGHCLTPGAPQEEWVPI
jgi:hypothetical protein